MAQDPVTPAPSGSTTPLPPEVARARMDELVERVRAEGCNGLAVGLARGIADPSPGYNGHTRNVYNVLPSLFVSTPVTVNGQQGVSRAPDIELDIDRTPDASGRSIISKDELAAAVLAGASLIAQGVDPATFRDAEGPNGLSDQFMSELRVQYQKMGGTCPGI